jgi:hypothetical protein
MRRRTASARDKEQQEQNRLVRMWRQWHRVLCAEALAGPHSELVRQVFELLRVMTLRDTRIIDLVQRTDWSKIDQKTREVLLHEIDRRITALREAAGLAPFADALPHQRPNGFLVIREKMTGVINEVNGEIE